jgi:large subunit ribosomal protein L30
MSQLKVTQVRSVIDRPKDQKDTIRRLGLRRMHDTVIKEDRPEIRGMLAKVRHLVTVEEVAASGRTRRPRKQEQPKAPEKEEGDQ